MYNVENVKQIFRAKKKYVQFNPVKAKWKGRSCRLRYVTLLSNFKRTFVEKETFLPVKVLVSVKQRKGFILKLLWI